MADRDPILVRFAESAGGAHSYRVAGRLVVSNRALDDLEAWRAADARTSSAPAEVTLPPPPAPLLYDDRAWVGGHFARVECRRSPEGFWLDIEGAGEFLVSSEGLGIVELRGPRVAANVRPADAVLGPCLCLALALGGVFCLHAAAAAAASSGDRHGSDSAIALAGLSGAGKSTLAAAFHGRHRETGGSWRRLADDILPITCTPVGAAVLPHFPQLKLPSAGQWGRESAGELPVTAIFRLTSTAQEEPVRVNRLGGREAAVAIIRHTVAGRLFDAELASAHLEFAGRLAAEVPVYEVAVPRGLSTVPEVLAAIESVL